MPILLAGAIGGGITIAAYELTGLSNKGATQESNRENIPDFTRPVPRRSSDSGRLPDGFGNAVQNSLQQVVHIRAAKPQSGADLYYQLPEPFRHFFDMDPHGGQSPMEMREQSGSGVIVSKDGYIVTNMHVIDKAEKIEVSLNDRRVFEAKLVGQDPATDIAVLKIAEKDLPYIRFANSDKVMVGDWVVAVGNPFNLASTVTAGIVSAKARNINVLRTQDNSAIESFIQTDAAVNPGNSGGALVNLNGDLVGINTAIATPTGVYAGYAFAVPSNIVAKVIDDIREHGEVKRGFVGVTIRELDWQLAKEMDLKSSAGVVVESVLEESAAAAAGLKEQDIILEVDGQTIASTPEFMGIVAQHGPGDELDFTILRGKKEKGLKVKLKAEAGNDAVLAEIKGQLLEQLGVELEPLPAAIQNKYRLRGVLVSKVKRGTSAYNAGLRAGSVIISVDRQPVSSVEEVVRAVGSRQGAVLVEVVYPGRPGVFFFAIGLDS
ncbi:MAG TPA: Do family serine endopeptidase [Adhaeribacter sp.]|nr:Do family serine endopeptidase [Adhaeribacter sp.]